MSFDRSSLLVPVVIWGALAVVVVVLVRSRRGRGTAAPEGLLDRRDGHRPTKGVRRGQGHDVRCWSS